jgi:CRISPR-associated protein Cas1
MLREHGFRCDYGEIYFAKDRQRHRIEISDELIEATKGAAERCRELAQAAQIPPPLNDSPKCHGCSLVGICLPDETIALRKSLIDFNPYANANEVGDDPWGLVGTPEATPESTAKTVRRMYPARDDRVPLYVQAPGATVNLDGERLIVRHRNQPPTNTRLSNTSHVALFGNSHITTPALKGLMRRGIPLLFFSYGGWYQGRASGPDTKNVELRLAQYKKTQDSITCLRLAQSFVASKILNCRTLLRRNHRSAPRVVLSELKQLARKARQAETTDSLLGIEGSAARVYFSEFAGMLKGDACDCGEFDMAGRNRRPPKDPINALLSFCYSLLTKELLIATHAVGLDSLLGFYHKPHFGRPSLALDLMEEFRPIIADSVVLNALNTKVVQNHDFQHAAGAVTLTDAGRRRLIQAFERRMDQPVTHPVFDYRISYRRVLEVQARLLTRYLLGEIAQYPEFRIR